MQRRLTHLDTPPQFSRHHQQQPAARSPRIITRRSLDILNHFLNYPTQLQPFEPARRNRCCTVLNTQPVTRDQAGVIAVAAVAHTALITPCSNEPAASARGLLPWSSRRQVRRCVKGSGGSLRRNRRVRALGWHGCLPWWRHATACPTSA